jgi:hypothetical protein
MDRATIFSYLVLNSSTERPGVIDSAVLVFRNSRTVIKIVMISFGFHDQLFVIRIKYHYTLMLNSFNF